MAQEQRLHVLSAALSTPLIGVRLGDHAKALHGWDEANALGS